MRLPVFMMILFALAAHPANAQELHLQSGEYRTQMIELFTSEGCSSCPPAEAFLNTYAQDPQLWQRVIPLAFHVDYWDYLGWRDPYASAAHSQRQRDYARHLRMNTVYTPALFINGTPWRNWRWGRTPNAGEEAVGQLAVVVEGTQLQASFTPVKAGPRPLMLHVAVLGMGLVSEIRAGENRGRSSRHEFVVLAHQRFSADKGRWRIEIPKPSLKAARYALVCWLSSADDPTPIQAVGAYLP